MINLLQHDLVELPADLLRALPPGVELLGVSEHDERGLQEAESLHAEAGTLRHGEHDSQDATHPEEQGSEARLGDEDGLRRGREQEGETLGDSELKQKSKT